MISVLVVEDDAFLAMDLEMTLSDRGHKVIGPAKSNAEALSLVDTHTVDVAILDVNLGKETSDAIADRLHEKGVPFLFLTGHSVEALPPAHQEAPIHSKPYREDALLTLLSELCA